MTHKADDIIFKLADESSFRQLFDRYYVTLCMFANEYVCDDLLAADIVQDCFVKLWQSRDGFTYIHQIKSFLYTSSRVVMPFLPMPPLPCAAYSLTPVRLM